VEVVSLTSYVRIQKKKEKNTISTFIQHLYEELQPNSPDMKNVEEVIWTDGPSSEFKNRFMAHLLQELSTKYKKIFKWKFFATSHGKGIVDGIGGRAKSIVRYKTRSQGDTAPIVQSAKDFADLVSSLMPNTKVFLIPQLDISQRTS